MAIELKLYTPEKMGSSEDPRGIYGLWKELVSMRDCILGHGSLDPETVEEILAFQHADGSFAILDVDRCDSDILVHYVHEPSYACCQILVKAANLRGADADPRLLGALSRGLDFCCARHLSGHGFTATSQQLSELRNFALAGYPELAAAHPELSPGFAEMLDTLLDKIEANLRQGKTVSDWERDFTDEMAEVLVMYGRKVLTPVFVYGTLMEGMPNAHLLEKSLRLGKATLEGYAMYDLGAFPGVKHLAGVKKGKRKGRRAEDEAPRPAVQGELVAVTPEVLGRLDRLEARGELYDRVGEKVRLWDGRIIRAQVYVYRGRVAPEAEIPSELQPWPRYAALKRTHVWYVSYGSNMLRERFMCYLAGGTCRFNGRTYAGCDDPTPPVLDRPIQIAHNVYFGNSSPSWGGRGAAFLDVSKPGRAHGRAYLISREQYAQLRVAEGSSSSWYPDEVDLGELCGIPMVTFTNKARRPGNAPSQGYIQAMREGLTETLYPDLAEVDRYMDEVAGRVG